MFYLDNNDTQHCYGVAITVTKDTHAAVMNSIPYSDQTMLIQLQGNQHACIPSTDKTQTNLMTDSDLLEKV